MTKDEALKLALMQRAFEKTTGRHDAWTNPVLRVSRNAFVAGWEAALPQPEQEPVAILFGTLPVYDTTPPPQRHLESTTDMMMELADRLGELPDDVDPRAWSHLLVYAPQRQPEPVESLAAEVIGCFHAAEIEGLQEALAETTDERLKDLVERRLMHALYAAQNTAPPQRQPLTDEEIKAIFLRELGDLAVRIPPGWRKVVNAIEAAHGIGDKT